MALTDAKVHPNAHLADKLVQASRDNVPISQTGLKVGIHRPGHRFRVLGVEVFCSAVAATASVDVKIGTTSVLSAVITPSAAARVAGSLATALASLVGTASEDINIEVTTNGTGTVDDLIVTVRYRPFPVNQEVDSASL